MIGALLSLFLTGSGWGSRARLPEASRPDFGNGQGAIHYRRSPRQRAKLRARHGGVR